MKRTVTKCLLDWVLGAKPKSCSLGSAWLKSKSNPSWANKKLRSGAKSASLHPRGEVTPALTLSDCFIALQTGLAVDIRCKLRVEKTWFSLRLSGMDIPLSCAGPWASLPWSRTGESEQCHPLSCAGGHSSLQLPPQQGNLSPWAQGGESALPHHCCILWTCLLLSEVRQWFCSGAMLNEYWVCL